MYSSELGHILRKYGFTGAVCSYGIERSTRTYTYKSKNGDQFVVKFILGFGGNVNNNPIVTTINGESETRYINYDSTFIDCLAKYHGTINLDTMISILSIDEIKDFKSCTINGLQDAFKITEARVTRYFRW